MGQNDKVIVGFVQFIASKWDGPHLLILLRVCMQNHSPLGFFWLWFCVVALLVSSPKKHEQYSKSWNNHEKKKWTVLEEGLGWTVDSARCTHTVLSPYLTSLLLVLPRVRALLGRICLSWLVLWRIKGTPWEVPSNNGWISTNVHSRISSKCWFGLQIQLQGKANKTSWEQTRRKWVYIT